MAKRAILALDVQEPRRNKATMTTTKSPGASSAELPSNAKQKAKAAQKERLGKALRRNLAKRKQTQGKNQDAPEA